MENTKIEWATDTFNPWEGCAKVSPGCKNCYAEGQHKLHHAALAKGDNPGTCWGVNAPRLGKSEQNWNKPLKWNRQAAATGTRRRVFCASMADVFEPQSPLSAAFAGQTAQVPTGGGNTRTVTFVDLAAERLRLLRLIYDTPHLDWLLLTKRPENIVPALEAAWESTTVGEDLTQTYELRVWLGAWLNGTPPANVWLGTSVENQEQADARVPHLLAAPAAVRFLSCEPLLGPVDLGQAGAFGALSKVEPYSAAWYGGHTDFYVGRKVDWVIVGGESGPRARPMHSTWAYSLLNDCRREQVAFFFKQWGEYKCFFSHEEKPDGIGAKGRTDWHNWPGGAVSVKLGKQATGRELGECTWGELPAGKEVARG